MKQHRVVAALAAAVLLTATTAQSQGRQHSGRPAGAHMESRQGPRAGGGESRGGGGASQGSGGSGGGASSAGSSGGSGGGQAAAPASGGDSGSAHQGARAAGRAVSRGEGKASNGGSNRADRDGGAAAAGGAGNGQAVARGSRDPGGEHYAVPRGDDDHHHGGGGTVIVPVYPGYYPWAWGWGGVGFGAYYGGLYDPWWYDGYGGGTYQSGGGTDEGALRIKVKPRNASVYVDGYFAGTVDEFDGMFQRLHIEPGPHRIEIRSDGYESLFIDVRIQPARTTTFEGELKPIQ